MSLTMRKSVTFCCGDKYDLSDEKSILDIVTAMLTEDSFVHEKPDHSVRRKLSNEFQCRECKKYFLTEQELQRHVSSPLSRLIQKLKEKNHWSWLSRIC